MKILLKNISDIIVAEVNAINDKVKGLNFLEILKINAIEKISPLVNDHKIPFDEGFIFEKDIEKNMYIKIKYLNEPLSISKKTIEYDSLFLSLNETSYLDIYHDEKKYTNIAIYKNNGVSLPKSSVVNLKCNKNVLLIEIQNKNAEQVLIK